MAVICTLRRIPPKLVSEFARDANRQRLYFYYYKVPSTEVIYRSVVQCEHRDGACRLIRERHPELDLMIYR